MNISFGTLISLQTLQNALNLLGYPAVTLFIMIESIGIPFPGESMLLIASFYSAIDNHLQIPIVIACAAFGAIVGDNIGYYIGRTGGRAFAKRFGKYIFLKPGHLDYAEQFFLKHGNKTVFLGRFIAILRIWAAFLAGLNKMHWRMFLLYNAMGGIVWATIVGILGYLAGRVFKNNFGLVEQIAGTVGWISGGLVLACVVIAIIILRIRQKRHSRDISTAKDNDPEIDIDEREVAQCP